MAAATGAIAFRAGGARPRPAPLVRWLALSVLAFLMEEVVVYGGGVIQDHKNYLLPAAHLLLMPFLLVNLSFWGLRIVLVGLLLNLTVMLANGGLMPVEQAAVDAVGRQEASELQMGGAIPGTKNVLLLAEDIKLRELSDRIILPLPKPLTKAVSVGDLFIFPGFALTLVEVTTRWRSPRRDTRRSRV